MRNICVTALLPSALLFAQGGFNGPGRYEIMNAQSRKVLDLDRNDRRTIIQFESRGTDNQIWDISRAPNGAFYLINAMDGSALEQVNSRKSTPVECRPAANSSRQEWRIEPGPNGNAVIVSGSGMALDIPDGTDRNGVKVQVYDRNNEDNQQFVFRRAGRGGAFGGGVGLGGNRSAPPEYSRPGPAERYWDDRDRMYKTNGDGVCFYRETTYGGDAYCVRAGDQLPSLPGEWNGQASSMKLFGRVRDVEVFTDRDYRGRSSRISRDEPNLNRARISSFRVN